MHKINVLERLRLPGKHRFILLALLIIILVRIIFIGFMGLMPQDAYYHFYGEHLALSYFDHPPAIAYLLRFFTTVFGKKVYVLKLADSLVTLCTIFSFYHLAKLFLSRHRVQNALILFLSTLMVTLLSLVSTPDVPLILFRSLSLITLYHAVFFGKNIYWIWSGVMMGFAFDSKYTGLLLPVGMMLFLVLSNTYRKLILTRWLWLCLVFFCITVSPVVIWNVQNDFASFRFQSAGRLQSMDGLHISLVNFIGVIGHQSAILMPILFFALLFFVYRRVKKYLARRVRVSSQQLFLLSFFIPVFTGFLCISFIYWVKINWLMPAYVSGIILISTYFTEKWIRYQLLFSVAVHVLLAAEVVFYPVIIKSDDTWMGWDDLAAKVKVLKSSHPGTFIFSADDYKTSAVLNFYSDSMVYSRNVIGEPALQFDFIGTDLNTLKGKDALFINSIPNFKDDVKGNDYPALLPGYFDALTELDPILIKKNSRTVRKYLVFYCKNYHPKNNIASGALNDVGGTLKTHTR